MPTTTVRCAVCNAPMHPMADWCLECTSKGSAVRVREEPATMPTITAARHIRYDERTDLREYDSGPETEEDLAELQHSLDNDSLTRIEPGLVGWPPFTHTLFSEAWGVYHCCCEVAP